MKPDPIAPSPLKRPSSSRRRGGPPKKPRTEPVVGVVHDDTDAAIVCSMINQLPRRHDVQDGRPLCSLRLDGPGRDKGYRVYDPTKANICHISIGVNLEIYKSEQNSQDDKNR